MERKSIVFTKPYTAEFIEEQKPEVSASGVLVKMEYTVISGGTERAVITNSQNTAQSFPCRLGYCGVGFVDGVGDAVKTVKVGDRARLPK